MKRVGTQQSPLPRLLLAVAASVLLHGAAAWAIPGFNRQHTVSGLSAQITGPVAESTATVLGQDLRAQRGAGRQARADPMPGDFVDPQYYGVSELDVFPSLSRRLGLSGLPVNGYIRVSLRIDASGRVTEALIFESNLGESDKARALRAIDSAKFVAARRNGRRVRSQIIVELRSSEVQEKDSTAETNIVKRSEQLVYR